jgi:hypothetical protein
MSFFEPTFADDNVNDQSMNCSCPKCNAGVPVDLSGNLEEETAITCGECRTGFFVYKESFACRASRKAGDIYCMKCGHQLSHKQYCPGCLQLYPDYLLVSSGRRKARKIVYLAEDRTYRPETTKKTFSLAGSGLPAAGHKFGFDISARKSMSIAISGVVALLLLSIGGVYFYNHKIQKQYSKNFVVALYGIKSGTDMNLRISSKIAGAASQSRITSEDEADLNTVKAEIDSVMQKLDNRPKKFNKANDILTNMYGVYTRLHSSVVAPSKSQPAFTDSVKKLEGNFQQEANNLKTNLPPELLDEIKQSGNKYKSLRFMYE